MKNKLLLVLGALSFMTMQAKAQTGDLTKDKINLLENKTNVLNQRIDSTSWRIKTLEKFKVSGYFQAQAEVGEIGAKTRTGANGGRYDEVIDGKDADFFTRYGLRRSRIKFQYSEKFMKIAFGLDLSEKGVAFKEAYLQLDDPYLNMFSLKTGVIYVGFSDEVNYSSSKRESPEHSLIVNKLIPDEKDLGTQLRITAPKNTPLEGLKLDLGLFSGNGIRVDDNSKMDFVARLKYEKSISKISFGLGASLYNGKVNNADSLLYTVKNGAWTSEEVTKNQMNKRQYFGFDAQFAIKTIMGSTSLRGEYLFGYQPSILGDFASPKSNSYIPASAFSYQRPFSGGYVYFLQDIYKTPLTFVVKYSYLDPNTQMKGDEISNKADVTMSTLGIGGLWQINSALRLMAFYDINNNERTANLIDYDKDVKDNVFTLRLQYKF